MTYPDEVSLRSLLGKYSRFDEACLETWIRSTGLKMSDVIRTSQLNGWLGQTGEQTGSRNEEKEAIETF